MKTGKRRRSLTTAALLLVALAALLVLLSRGGGDVDGGPAPAARPAKDDAVASTDAAPLRPDESEVADDDASGTPTDPAEEGRPLVVRGRLLDGNGRPLAGRGVCVGGPETLRFLAREMARGREVLQPELGPCRTADGVFSGAWRLARTGPDGSFEIRLPGLPAGGYDLTFLGEHGVEARLAGIALDPSAPADLGEVRAAVPGSISGRVVDGTGAYVADAPVQCFPTDDLATEEFDVAARAPARRLSPFLVPREGLRVRLAYTDEHGDFAFEGLRPGTYRLFATREGTDVGGTLGGIRVEPGRLTGPVRVRLDTKGGWIAGRVTVRDGGDPPENVRVTAGGMAARTDRNGHFRVGPIWPGRVDLVARAPGCRPAFAGLFDVAAGEELADVVVELVPDP